MQPEEDLLVVRPLPAMAAEAAAMGRDSALGVDPDARYVEQGNVSLTARKAWAVMKITGALMKGIVVHPGGDAPDTEIEKASRDLMARGNHDQAVCRARDSLAYSVGIFHPDYKTAATI